MTTHNHNPNPELCSVCQGEKDAEGWCANYCTEDDLDEAFRNVANKLRHLAETSPAKILIIPGPPPQFDLTTDRPMSFIFDHLTIPKEK